MPKFQRSSDRDDLLADVAEMYYEGDLTQEEISVTVGITRSAISRMLKEARDRGIVHIQVQRPLRFDRDLAQALVERFGLRDAHVLVWNGNDRPDILRERLGQVAAQTLASLLGPGTTLGVAWGTTVSATIDAFDASETLPMRVIQLVGVLGSSGHASNAQALVERMARKVGGEGVYLYTPLIVENAATARSLLKNQHVRETIEAARTCVIALLGVGTTDPETCSLYHSGHISADTLESLRAAGAVGDVNAYYFDIDGRAAKLDFDERVVGVPRDDLLHIETRLGVAGGVAKARSILGALRGKYINHLVTDSATTRRVLVLDSETGSPASPDQPGTSTS